MAFNLEDDTNKVQEIESQDEESDEVFLEKLKRKGRRYKGRKGISGEVYSSIKTQEASKKSNYSKCEEDKIKILIRLRNFIFFKNLSEQSIEEIISCMKARIYNPGDVVIKQGDLGN